MEFHGPRTQILEEGKATDEAVVVYTVPVGKKFYMIESILVVDAGATGTAQVEIHTEAHVHIRHLNWMMIRENNKGIIPADHCHPAWPIEMSAGEHIMVSSNAAFLEAQCDIFGFEVDA